MSTTHPNRAARRELAERLAAVILPPRLPAAERLVEILEQVEALASLLASAAEIDAGGFHFLSGDHVQGVARSISQEVRIARHLLDLVDDHAPAPCPDPFKALAGLYFDLSADERETLKHVIGIRHSDDSQAALADLVRRGLRDVVREDADPDTMLPSWLARRLEQEAERSRTGATKEVQP